MFTYEVKIDMIANGKTINLLVAAQNDEWAPHEVACTLESLGLNPREHYDLQDLRIERVEVRPVGKLPAFSA